MEIKDRQRLKAAKLSMVKALREIEIWHSLTTKESLEILLDLVLNRVKGVPNE